MPIFGGGYSSYTIKEIGIVLHWHSSYDLLARNAKDVKLAKNDKN
jgi:hypothetical protein